VDIAGIEHGRSHPHFMMPQQDIGRPFHRDRFRVDISGIQPGLGIIHGGLDAVFFAGVRGGFEFVIIPNIPAPRGPPDGVRAFEQALDRDHRIVGRLFRRLKNRHYFLPDKSPERCIHAVFVGHGAQIRALNGGA
jgi:hypothetical protein